MNEKPMNPVRAQKVDVSELVRSPAWSTEPSRRRADCIPVWLHRAYSKMEAFGGMWLHCSVLALLLCSVANLCESGSKLCGPAGFCSFLLLRPPLTRARWILCTTIPHTKSHIYSYLHTHSSIMLQTG